MSARSRGIGSNRSRSRSSYSHSLASRASHSRSSSASSHSSSNSSSAKSRGTTSTSTSTSHSTPSASSIGSGAGKSSWGGYSSHISGMGLGTSMHEGFSKSVGNAYSGGSRGNGGGVSASQQKAISEHTFSKMASQSTYGMHQQSEVGGLTGSGTVSDMWSSVKDMFSDTATPTDAFEGYGFQKKEYSQTPFGERSYSEQWAHDKLGTLANVMSNPMVSGAMWAGGLGLVSTGVQVASAIKDYAEGDIDLTGGLGRVAGAALSSPLGKSLGQFQGVATAIAKDFGSAGETLAGFAGGKAGEKVGSALGEAFGNPYVGAAATVAGAVLGGKAAKAAVGGFGDVGVGDAMTAAAVSRTQAGQRGGGSRSRTPSRPQVVQQAPQGTGLASTGQRAISQSQQLQMEDPDVTEYIQNGYNPFVSGVTSYSPTTGGQYNPYA